MSHPVTKETQKMFLADPKPFIMMLCFQIQNINCGSPFPHPIIALIITPSKPVFQVISVLYGLEVSLHGIFKLSLV